MDGAAPRHELVYRQAALESGAAWPFYSLIAANSLALLVGAFVRGDAMASLGLLLAATVVNSGSALLMIRGRSRQDGDARISVISRELEQRCHLDRIPGRLRRLSLGGARMVVAPRNAPLVGTRARLMFALDGFEFVMPVEVIDSERRSGSTTLDLAFDPSDLELVAGLLPVLPGAPERRRPKRARPPFDRAA